MSIQSLEERLEAAEQRLAKLPRPKSLSGRLDHGMVNLPLSKRGNIEADTRKGVAIIEAEREVTSLRNRIAYAKKNAAVPFTGEELKAAKLIRTSVGWHKVVRVNAKTVTVETAYSWTDRYPIAQVLEVR